MLKLKYFSGVSQVYDGLLFYVNIKKGINTIDSIKLVLEWTRAEYVEGDQYELIDCGTWEEFLEKASHKRFSKDLLGLVRLNYMIGEKRAKV